MWCYNVAHHRRFDDLPMSGVNIGKLGPVLNDRHGQPLHRPPLLCTQPPQIHHYFVFRERGHAGIYIDSNAILVAYRTYFNIATWLRVGDMLYHPCTYNKVTTKSFPMLCALGSPGSLLCSSQRRSPHPFPAVLQFALPCPTRRRGCTACKLCCGAR